MIFSPSPTATSARSFFSNLFGTSSSFTLNLADLKPPQPPPVWTHTPEDILSLTKEAIERHRKVQDRVAKLPDSECNFNTVFSALALSNAEFETVTNPLSFYRDVSSSKELRDVSNEAQKLIRDYYDTESSMRVDVFNATVMAKKNANAECCWIKYNLEEHDLMKLHAIGPGRHLDLKEALRLTQEGVLSDCDTRSELLKVNAGDNLEQLKQWKRELSQVCIEFKKNFDEENVNLEQSIISRISIPYYWPQGFVSFTLKELKGVPQDVISSYAKHIEDGKELYDVRHRTWDILPLLKYAQDADTRQQAYESYKACLELNAPLLDHAIELRHHIATWLGYKSWADYKTKWRMAKSGDNVEKFLADLEQTLHPLGVKERETLLQLKANELKAKGKPYTGEFYIWDYYYYNRLYQEKFLSLDEALITQYFPPSAVVPATLEIFQNFFGMHFQEVKGSQTWHPDVQLFAVWAADAKDESDFMGYCYLDLYQRASKHVQNPAVWTLCPSYLLPNGKRVYPVTAMIANLIRPTLNYLGPGCPALMLHKDVILFFREMGRTFHNLLSRTQFSCNHASRIPCDFREAPLYLVENWCWEPKVLKKISRHYQTNKALSDKLIKKIVKSRYANIGLRYLHRIFLASFDLQVHTHQAWKKQDTTTLWNVLQEQISLLKGGESIAGQGLLDHLVIGYDVAYYASLYSEIFAEDMYSTIFKGNPLNLKGGIHFRKVILEPGVRQGVYFPLERPLGCPLKREAYAFMKKLNKLTRDHN